MIQRLFLYSVLLFGLLSTFSACTSDSGGGDGTDPIDNPSDTSSSTDPNKQPKPKPATKVPKQRDLMNSSTHLNQFNITPARENEILHEYQSEKNEEADISLKLLTKGRFHLEILLLADDFPLTLVGGYGEEEGAYILQFTDSELAKKIFSEAYNADSNVQMLSASEVSFSQTAQHIGIWGIRCNKK